MDQTFSIAKLHPQNIFGESILLFVVGLLLIVRDRGSAVSSMTHDPLLGSLLIIFSFIRMIEFLGASRDSHIMARAIVWFMWTIPIAILAWLAFVYRRWDIGVLLGLSIAAIIAVTIYLISGSGGYDIISPDQRVGASNGIYTWIRTDGVMNFLPFTFYILLAVTLIYLTFFSLVDKFYWILVAATVIAFVIASICIPEITLATLGSLSSLVMLAVGVLAILLVPG